MRGSVYALNFGKLWLTSKSVFRYHYLDSAANISKRDDKFRWERLCMQQNNGRRIKIALKDEDKRNLSEESKLWLRIKFKKATVELWKQ